MTRGALDGTSGYADVNGVRLHYVAQGSGPLILFLHGFPEFWYAWRNQLAEFGRDHQAVAVDMRGYNLSSKPESVDDYRIGVLVEDVAGLADHFGAEKFVLVGHDWGGAVAWAFAIAHPERLERLVILNAPHQAIFARELMSNPAQQQASAYMLALRAPEAERAFSADNFARLRALGAELLTGGHFTDADADAYVESWSRPGALTGALNYYRAARFAPAAGGSGAGSPPTPSGAMTVMVPTLVIWGERDRYLLPSLLDGLDSFVLQLTLHRIPDATHWVVHEKKEEVNAAIRAFLAT